MMTLEQQKELARRQRELNERFDADDRRQEAEDVKAVLSTEAGRRVFAAICWRGYVYGNVYPSVRGDAISLAYETGRREFAVDVYRRANIIDPVNVLKAIEERNATGAKRRNQFEDLKKDIERDN